MNARTGPCTRCLGALGLSVSLGIAASAVAAPVVYRNGDGAWFNCKRYLVCENRIPVYLDVSLAPGRQTGQNTGRSIKHSFSCDPACWCCPVSEDWDANGVGAQICLGPEPWLVGDECDNPHQAWHVPLLEYAMSVPGDGAKDWGELGYFSYLYSHGGGPGASVDPEFIGVRFRAADGAWRYGWVSNHQRHPREIDNDGWERSFYPTAWAFETEPDTPIATPACAADINYDFQVDFFDYLQFVEDFDAGHWICNFDGNDQIDFFDYLDFLEQYAACDR